MRAAMSTATRQGMRNRFKRATTAVNRYTESVENESQRAKAKIRL
jgi:hypothetical protein